MSETYTAVYAREGDQWVAEITGQAGVSGRGASLGEAREQIRQALSTTLAAPADALHIVDTIKPPTQYQAMRTEVHATRTDADKAKMMGNMTDQKTAAEWAKELGTADREPGAIKWLADFGDVELGIDQLCHTITLAEEIARWGEVDMDEPAPNSESAQP